MKTRTQNNNTSRPRFHAMRKAATTLVGSFVAVAALTLAACSDDDLTSSVTPAITPSAVEFQLPDELQRLVYTDEYGEECLPLIKGEAVQLPYTVEPDTATFKDMQWTSSDETVATVDQEGNVKAISGDGNGYSTITVVPVGYYADADINATIKVVVSNEMVKAETIAINASTEEFYGGDTLHLQTVIAPENSTYKTVEWSSSDESLATVSADGILTAQVTEASSAPVTITATALDGSGVTATKEFNIRQIVQPEEVDIDQTYSAENGYLCAFNEKSLTLGYTTVPAECTTSIIQWTTSDPAVATVDNGVVTFTGLGNVTITATCPETGQSSSINLDIPAGLIRETYHNPDYYSFYDAGQSGNGTETSTEWHDGYITVTTYTQTAGSKQRADLKWHNLPLYMNVGNYPILAVRMEDSKDKGATKRNLNIDSKAVGLQSGTAYNGVYSGNNKYAYDWKCSDGSHIFIYDYATTNMPTNETVEFTLFQIKNADMETLAEPIQYNVYWLQTFKTLDDIRKYVTETEGLTITE